MSGTPNTTGPAGPGQPAAGPRCARCGTTDNPDTIKPLSENTAALCWQCRIDASAARRGGRGHGDRIDRQLRRIRSRGKRR